MAKSKISIKRRVVDTLKEDEKKIIVFYNFIRGKFLSLIKNNPRMSGFIGGILMVSLIISIAFAIVSTKVDNSTVVDCKTREAIIEIYYPKIDQTVSRDTFKTTVDTIFTESKMPMLLFAIIFHESKFNPTAISKTGARGVAQIISNPGWTPKLKEDNVINETGDLHDPIIGVKAGDRVLGYHMTRANGDLMRGLNDYVGSVNSPGQTKYVRDVLSTLGHLYLIQVAKDKMAITDLSSSFTWWDVGEKVLLQQKSKTNK